MAYQPGFQPICHPDLDDPELCWTCEFCPQTNNLHEFSSDTGPLPDTLVDDFTHLFPTSQVPGNLSWPGDDQSQILCPATDSAGSSELPSSQVSSIVVPSIPPWMLAAALEILPVVTTVGPPPSLAAHPTPATRTTLSGASSGTPLYPQTANNKTSHTKVLRRTVPCLMSFC
ncbi:hypothetical protein NM208_g2323 [Fusarium decemcellulare]|uniref:Uncharacterized protein n=1 Tax=Fusarium decemcellulare TaxID=57161 RepID=A0ACC1STD5_9HYPO|nr:hypothetical protein NM208_g2323 [Fusarium decemcellulare]